MIFTEGSDFNLLSRHLCHAFDFEPPKKKPGDAVKETLKQKYPRAVTNRELVARVTTTLNDHGFGKSTLLATSLCCDEVNRVLEKDFSRHYGDCFNMGGLAGFPFGGVTSFGAMAHHIPDQGSCLILFGPHVGIDENGNVGSVNRRGRASPGACCGSACAALSYVQSVGNSGSGATKKNFSTDPIDAQQAMVGSMLLEYSKELKKAREPMVELPICLYEAQKKMIEKIVAAACQEVKGSGTIALLGGIQINTPRNQSDFFLPMDFELRSNKNEKIAELLWTRTEI